MTPKARNVVIICVAVFMVLHHDFWLWEDGTLVFGFQKNETWTRSNTQKEETKQGK